MIQIIDDASYLANIANANFAELKLFKADIEPPLLVSPDYLPSLAIWLDCIDARSITLNGATVASWQNKGNIVGVGNATQSTALNQPLYLESGINGRPALRGLHDGINVSQLIVPDNSRLKYIQGHLFAVVQRTINQSNISFIAGKTSTAGNQREFRIQAQPNANNNINETFVSADGTSTNATYLTRTAINVGIPFIADLSFIAGTDGVKFATTQHTTEAVGTVTTIFNGVSPFTLFSRETSFSDGFSGLIGEILFYKSVLTLAQKTSLLQYLRNKWGIP